MNEIDENFFCTTDLYDDSLGFGDCIDDLCGSQGCGRQDCKNFHRKWPTPEQFEEEYGKEVPDDFPVWLNAWYENEKSMYVSGEYELMKYAVAKSFIELKNDDLIKRWAILCACTPFGKPPKDWRPR